MATVIIREYAHWARSAYGAGPVEYPAQPLLTDQQGLPIKVFSSGAAPADAPQLLSGTHVIEIEPDADVRFAVRPRDVDAATVVPATPNHPIAKAGEVTVVAVPGAAIISFIDA